MGEEDRSPRADKPSAKADRARGETSGRRRGLYPPMKTHRNLPSFPVVLALAGLALPTLSGCVAVLAGAGAAGAVAYVRGELDVALEAPVDRTVRATNQAILDLKFAKISESRDVAQDVFVIRNASDQKIEIRVDRVSDTVSRVKIRVGVFGDEALSLLILDKIKAAL